MWCQDALGACMPITGSQGQTALPYARRCGWLRRPRGNRNAMKHGLYTRQALRDRRQARHLMKEARALLTSIED